MLVERKKLLHVDDKSYSLSDIMNAFTERYGADQGEWDTVNLTPDDSVICLAYSITPGGYYSRLGADLNPAVMFNVPDGYICKGIIDGWGGIEDNPQLENYLGVLVGIKEGSEHPTFISWGNNPIQTEFNIL